MKNNSDKNTNKKQYNPKEIETKWDKIWTENELYKVEELKDVKKYHAMDMFPYPSGEGLHVGHVKQFSSSDAFARFKRMQGFNVLHATGWDAFGLPAEQFAIKNKVNPKISTDKNIENFKKQMHALGFSYDWSRTVNTTDPKFYKWTQWIFKQIYKKGLVHESFEPINWCPSCKTGLANEDLEDGKCERCNSVVEKKPIRQWVIEITRYAEELLKGVNDLNWKESVKDMQRNWIGKSEGAEIGFEIRTHTPPSLPLPRGGTEHNFTIFTTRPDTLFGCTYCVFAPEHELVKKYLESGEIQNKKEVLEYIEQVKNKTEIERTALGKEKTGVKLEGLVAINPVNQKEVSVYIADYVLANYGSGAIMAVPAHDERDFQFAKKYNIESFDVVDSKNKLINSQQFDGMESEKAKKKITEYVGGKMVTKYKLKDWVFARQRYWGEPFPIVFDENRKAYLVADECLPVRLPEVENYEPTGDGESPLKNIKEFVEVWGYVNGEGEFVETQTPPNPPLSRAGTEHEVQKFYRETNTMPQWAGSSWYWLRYMDPNNQNEFVSKEKENYWGEVDNYMGGLEHATRHLIYGRFWHKVLFDLGFVSTAEPFKRLEGVGLVLGSDGQKISKRLGNGVPLDEVLERFGADTTRLYIMFMSSYHDAAAFKLENMVGPRRFIERVWNMQYNLSEKENTKEVTSLLHKTIKKVGEDNEQLKYNTSISALMILYNELEKEESANVEVYKDLLKMLAPFVPFVVEEIWNSISTPPLTRQTHGLTQQGGEQDTIVQENISSIHKEFWPKYDESKLVNDTQTLAIQINGKLRATIDIKPDESEENIKKLVAETDEYKKWVGDITPKKVIIVKNRVINIVV
jgi:leucyl-tRNA synthetase